MQAAYESNDGIRRVELGFATGKVAASVPTLVDQLNQGLLAELVRAVQFSGKFNQQFVADTNALLSGANYGMYRTFADVQNQEYTRPQFPREAVRSADMTRLGY